MARRLLSSRAYAELFGVPTDSEALIRHYLLSGDDIDLAAPPWPGVGRRPYAAR